MRTNTEIMADLKNAKQVASSLNLSGVAACDVTDEHREAARALNALIREQKETWSQRGASSSSDDRAEWERFTMQQLEGTEMSAWVSFYA